MPTKKQLLNIQDFNLDKCDDYSAESLKLLASKLSIRSKSQRKVDLCQAIEKFAHQSAISIQKPKIEVQKQQIRQIANAIPMKERESIVDNIKQELEQKSTLLQHATRRLEQYELEIQELKQGNQQQLEKSATLQIKKEELEKELKILKSLLKDLEQSPEAEESSFHQKFQNLLTSIRKFEPSKKCRGDWKKTTAFLNYLLDTKQFEACIPKNSTFYSDSFVDNLKEKTDYSYVFAKEYQTNVKTGKEVNNNTASIYYASSGSIGLAKLANGQIEIEVPNDLKQEIESCTHNFIVIYLSLRVEESAEQHGSGHANMIFVDKRHKRYERFEPNGSETWELYDWVDGALAHQLRKFMPAEYEFEMTPETCPAIGPQVKAATPEGECGQQGGYCVVFSTMAAHLKMMSPETPTGEIYAIWLELSDKELLDIIQRYLTWVDSVVPDQEQDPDGFVAFTKRHMSVAQRDTLEHEFSTEKIVANLTNLKQVKRENEEIKRENRIMSANYKDTRHENELLRLQVEKNQNELEKYREQIDKLVPLVKSTLESELKWKESTNEISKRLISEERKRSDFEMKLNSLKEQTLNQQSKISSLEKKEILIVPTEQEKGCIVQ